MCTLWLYIRFKIINFLNRWKILENNLRGTFEKDTFKKINSYRLTVYSYYSSNVDIFGHSFCLCGAWVRWPNQNQGSRDHINGAWDCFKADQLGLFLPGTITQGILLQSSVVCRLVNVNTTKPYTPQNEHTETLQKPKPFVSRKWKAADLALLPTGVASGPLRRLSCERTGEMVASDVARFIGWFGGLCSSHLPNCWLTRLTIYATKAINTINTSKYLNIIEHHETTLFLLPWTSASPTSANQAN